MNITNPSRLLPTSMPLTQPTKTAPSGTPPVSPATSPKDSKPTGAILFPGRFNPNTKDIDHQRALTGDSVSASVGSKAQELGSHLISENAREHAPLLSSLLSTIPGKSDQPRGAIKAVYALGQDAAVLGSANSLVNKLNQEGAQEHSPIGFSKLSTLGAQDKLTLVGHGSQDSFGGLEPEALADHLKSAGVTSLSKISLKGCDSAEFAQKLFSALDARGIQIGSITGRTAKVVVAQNGKTLVERNGQYLHKVEGSKFEITKSSSKDVYANNSVASVQQASSAIADLGNSGELTPRTDANTMIGKLADDATTKLVSNYCQLDAVCWDWALHGGQGGQVDPRAHMFDHQANFPGVFPAEGAEITNDIRTNYLTTMLQNYGDIRPGLPNSHLKVRAYFENNELSLRHIEFIIDDELTITKGNGDPLKAVRGDSVVPDTVRIELPIRWTSLNAHHQAAFVDLAAAHAQANN